MSYVIFVRLSRIGFPVGVSENNLKKEKRRKVQYTSERLRDYSLRYTLYDIIYHVIQFFSFTVHRSRRNQHCQSNHRLHTRTSSNQIQTNQFPKGSLFISTWNVSLLVVSWTVASTIVSNKIWSTNQPVRMGRCCFGHRMWIQLPRLQRVSQHTSHFTIQNVSLYRFI